MKRLFLTLLLTLSLTSTCLALSPADLWYTRDQQAAHAFAKGDMQRAAELFENPYWKASAAYKSGDYPEALTGFDHATTSDDYYNKANTLAYLKRYEESIKAYDKALELDANNKDAEFNREIVKKLLEEKKQDDKKDQNKDQQDKKDQQQDQKQDEKNNAGQGGSNNNKPDQKDNQQNKADQKPDQNPGDKQNQPQDQSKQDQASPDKKDQKQSEPSQPSQAKTEAANVKETDDQKQTNKWLAQIPDDPGGLLQQKFLRDHQRLKNGD